MKKLLPLLMLSLAACTPNVKDRDFDKEEIAYIKENGIKSTDPLWQKPTNKVVQAGKMDGVTVVMYRDTDIREGELNLQQWKALIINKNDEPKCVQTVWQLMDFQMYTDYPDFLKVPANSTFQNYARMTQKIWVLDGVRLALPPSGYIADMLVREPNDKGTCVFEQDIKEM